jgi:hypothetical protein
VQDFIDPERELTCNFVKIQNSRIVRQLQKQRFERSSPFTLSISPAAMSLPLLMIAILLQSFPQPQAHVSRRRSRYVFAHFRHDGLERNAQPLDRGRQTARPAAGLWFVNQRGDQRDLLLHAVGATADQIVETRRHLKRIRIALDARDAIRGAYAVDIRNKLRYWMPVRCSLDRDYPEYTPSVVCIQSEFGDALAVDGDLPLSNERIPAIARSVVVFPPLCPIKP